MSTFALRPLDYAIVAAYLALIVAMGSISAQGQALDARLLPLAPIDAWWLAARRWCDDVLRRYAAGSDRDVVKNGVAGNWLCGRCSLQEC